MIQHTSFKTYIKNPKVFGHSHTIDDINIKLRFGTNESQKNFLGVVFSERDKALPSSPASSEAQSQPSTTTSTCDSSSQSTSPEYKKK
ncbi:hypothetical protein Trydic_g16938 [Trypoxylus dichotomus]